MGLPKVFGFALKAFPSHVLDYPPLKEPFCHNDRLWHHQPTVSLLVLICPCPCSGAPPPLHHSLRRALISHTSPLCTVVAPAPTLTAREAWSLPVTPLAPSAQGKRVTLTVPSLLLDHYCPTRSSSHPFHPCHLGSHSILQSTVLATVTAGAHHSALHSSAPAQSQPFLAPFISSHAETFLRGLSRLASLTNLLLPFCFPLLCLGHTIVSPITEGNTQPSLCWAVPEPAVKGLPLPCKA